MQTEYFILDCREVVHSVYGNIIAFRANPVETNPVGMMFMSPTLGENTETFFFPNNKCIIAPIQRIGQSQEIWTPNPSDYKDERTYDRNVEKHIIIHYHKSFWSNDYDSSMNRGNPTIFVPNATYKANQLVDRFIKNGWLYSGATPREYAQSLASDLDGSDFLSWLFDDPSIKGYSIWDLDEEYQEAFENFLNRFGEY